MKKRKIIRLMILSAACLWFFSASWGYAGPVYPDSGLWENDTRNTAAQPIISAEKPRSGNASLKLTTSTPYEDWSFYVREADDQDTGWGLLSEISGLSFEWYRKTETNRGYSSGDPWNIQTPVLRLLIKDGDYFSELVWEKYYTDSSYLTMKIGDWVSQDLIEQNFWRRTEDKGYTIKTKDEETSGKDLIDFTGYALMDLSTSRWAKSGALGLDYDYSEEAFVYGLSVGVGSQWPGPYTGYVDNIYLAFAGKDPVINDNFELPIPEPATMLLLGSGLAVFGAQRRWGKKIRRS